MAQTLRAVVAGCGGISGAWLGSVPKIRGLRIVGLVDPNEAAALKRKADYHLDDAVVDGDLGSVLKQTKPDVVFDCSLPETHVKVTLAALKHGCHVLGEKPMADTLENARRMVSAAKKARRVYAVMQNRRYDARIKTFRNVVGRGTIGDLHTLDCAFYIGAHFGGFRDRMRHVLLLDMAIHTFDAARYITGADPVAVYCRDWNPKGSWYDHDASAIAVFEMTGGLSYTYRGSWCSEGLNTTWESDWRAIGTRGSATWNGADAYQTQKVKKSGGFFSEMADVPVQAPKPVPLSGHAGCIADFVSCLRAGRIPQTVCTDNIHSLAMVFGAIASSETGKRVLVKD